MHVAVHTIVGAGEDASTIVTLPLTFPTNVLKFDDNGNRRHNSQ